MPSRKFAGGEGPCEFLPLGARAASHRSRCDDASTLSGSDMAVDNQPGQRGRVGAWRLCAITGAAAVAGALIVVGSLSLGTSGAYAQTPPSSKQILEEVARTQNAKLELEAKLGHLQGRLDSELHKLKAWAAAHAGGRTVVWPMTAARVEWDFSCMT